MERQIIPFLVRLAAVLMPWWDLGTGAALAAAALLSLATSKGRWRAQPADLALWSGFAALAASGLWTKAPEAATLLRWLPLVWVPLALRGQRFAWREGMVAGALVLSLVLLGRAAVLAATAGSWEPFFYRDFAEFAHQHSYITTYLALAAAFAAADPRFGRALRIILLVLFALVAVLAGSRMALLAAAVGGVLWVVRQPGLLQRRQAALMWSLAVAAVLVVAVAAVPSDRSLGKWVNADPYWATGSIDTRVVQAKAAMEVIGQAPWTGVGVDAVQAELERVYRSLNYRFGLSRHLNVHNQFLQLWAGIGLYGLALWALGLAYCIRHGGWSKGATALLAMMVLLFATESMLERAMGVVLLASVVYVGLPRRLAL